MLSRLLRRFGHTAETADSGEAALLRLTKPPLPDLVILDHMMPGASGLEVLQILHEESRTRDLPIVLFTAVQDEGLRRKALSLGATACWVKGSFDYGQLEDAVATLLYTARKPDQDLV